MAKKGVGEGY
jgi:hypothetical protein